MSGSVTAAFLTAAPVLPVVLTIPWLLPFKKARRPLLLVLAPLPALIAALSAVGSPPVVFWHGPVAFRLMLDLPAAMLLGVCSLLWIAAAVYAVTARRSTPIGVQFAICWLLTLAGSAGVFVAADLASFFLAYALVSIPAYGLVVYDGTGPARRAGGIYLAYAIVGETLLLMGFWLLAYATPDGSLSVQDALAALPGSPWRGATIGLLIAGFGMKIGLVPMHVWMPLTYRAAPVPAAAVLSGAAVKAGVIGLIRFLPFGEALPVAGAALAAVGLLGTFYGVLIGITQQNPKTVLAYSSISQMGLIAAVLGMGLSDGDATAGTVAAFYAAHHVLVKGALFLAVGLAAVTRPRRLLIVLLPALVLAFSLGGLPLTGGALAKLAVKASLGNGIPAILGSLSGATSTLLMLHFIQQLAAVPLASDAKAARAGLAAPWLVLAAASVAIPWALYPLATGYERSEALRPDVLWAALWPVLLGAVLAGGLYRLRDKLPRVPEGDILAATSGIGRASLRVSDGIDRMEGGLRQWPAASLSLLAVAILLGVTMLIAR
jgi:formate hydrogenlyase subunit 3/multisubunit Na+/H+ antiporter MnhD subunit